MSKVRDGLVWGNEVTIMAMGHAYQPPVHVWTSREGEEVVWNEYTPRATTTRNQSFQGEGGEWREEEVSRFRV